MEKIKDFIMNTSMDDYVTIAKVEIQVKQFMIDFAIYDESLGGKNCDLTISEILKNWDNEQI
jgi:hypothetical protein